MNTFQKNTAIVLDFMKEKGYSDHSIHCYAKIYQSLAEYLSTNTLKYTPEFGMTLLSAQSDIPFGVKGSFIQAASISKLNDVYENGAILYAQTSPRKIYSRLTLVSAYEAAASEFMLQCSTTFTKSQMENARRRCILLLKFLQSRGKQEFSDVQYEDILIYHHEELKHLKKQSRIVEESTIHQFLKYLAENGYIRHGFYLYMYVLETNQLVDVCSFTLEERQTIAVCNRHTLFSAGEFFHHGTVFLTQHNDERYVYRHHEAIKRAILHFYLFLDLHGLGYDPIISEIWINSSTVKAVFQGSSWIAARRALFLFKSYALSGEVDFTKVMPRELSGLKDLPGWCRDPLIRFAELRSKEKLDDDTVKNDIYSILRFCRFLISKGFTSYTDLTGEAVMEFNLWDKHLSAEGKNACNIRVRRYLRYLYREKVLTTPSLDQVLGYTAASVESIVITLTSEEISKIQGYIKNASTPVELRDSAIMLLGTEMGIRGCDIVNLRLTDINWKDRSICFQQDKTEVDVQLAMPTSVGNAIFRYLKDVRPQCSNSDRIFVSLHAPYKALTKNVCLDALKRMIPRRKVSGSGFHVTRKTFSTGKLRNGISLEKIAEAMGQRDKKSLTPYLSLDNDRLSMCPLSLTSLGIVMKGGFQ